MRLVENHISSLDPLKFAWCVHIIFLDECELLFFCRGIYPFNERRKLWERMRSKSRRNSNLASPEVVEGCEVRTKSHPIYTTGSIALNFSSGTPMVRVYLKDFYYQLIDI